MNTYQVYREYAYLNFGVQTLGEEKYKIVRAQEFKSENDCLVFYSKGMAVEIISKGYWSRCEILHRDAKLI